MAEFYATQATSILARSDQPLIGVFLEEDGRDMVRYFAAEEVADAAISVSSVQLALSGVGAWSDLDWAEMEMALDQIRHEPPT